ncbi:MAG: uracil-DNA glycosylase family protein [Gammaproteobacteria bacterium]|nr:uracil-DNA glycosylase family protein [Gammaproteobacteria bacterium]
MIGPVVTGKPIRSRIMSIGQAPGIREGELGQPFAWTAGKTLFKWFASIGRDECAFRESIYMAAVCRCFPGKLPKGGDRVPNKQEIAACRHWLDREFELLSPELVIPIGKLAIAQFLPTTQLGDVIGQQHRIRRNNHEFDLIPLPHPSGLSTWFKTEPGKSLLEQALKQIARHPAWASSAATCDPD